MYHFIEDNSCPNCGFRPETETHFFLQCHAYRAQFQAMLDGLILISQETFGSLINLNVQSDNDILTNILI